MRVPYIKVPQIDAKKEIDRLKRMGELLPGYKVKREGTWILVPVKHSEDETEFEVNVTRRMTHVGSFERISDFFVIKQREGWERILEEIKEKQSPRAIFLDDGVEGSFRIRKLRRIYGTGEPAGIHKENGFRYLVNLERAYFSPRLAGLRRDIIKSCFQTVKTGLVVDMYAGVGPLSIPLLKSGVKVLSIDMNQDATKLLRQNMKLNKVCGEVLVADSNRILDCFEGVDQVLMNNPSQPLSVFQNVVSSLGRGTIIHLTHISNRKDKIEFKGVEVVQSRIVHGYSPSSSLFYFRMRKK